MKILEKKKKHDIQDFWNTLIVTFSNYQQKNNFRVFLVFLTKEILMLSALKQKVLDEIMQSNGIKPQKNLLFKIFL